MQIVHVYNQGYPDFDSLIAIMLGRLEMTVDDCIATYTSMFKEVFEKRKHKLPIELWNLGKLQERFDSELLGDAIRVILQGQNLLDSTMLNCGEISTCRT